MRLCLRKALGVAGNRGAGPTGEAALFSLSFAAGNTTFSSLRSQARPFGASRPILPTSDAEGFSMAVLEVLASGTPVLLSPGCHFPEVERAGVGLVVSPTPIALAGV